MAAYKWAVAEGDRRWRWLSRVTPRERSASERVCGKCDRAQLAVNTPLAVREGGIKKKKKGKLHHFFLAVRFPRLNLAAEEEEEEEGASSVLFFP